MTCIEKRRTKRKVDSKLQLISADMRFQNHESGFRNAESKALEVCSQYRETKEI
jgi:hypothetical protein